ncbi:MAG: hypothetical protein K9N46_04675 [Candidatus Marinimicrobia bacterium]|nr:hypothetical protein [Candidatus Neomarinimicrobiota bacterium]MCF7829323.1 hypothetical protein [Candidatus Neomarinimicrobiota bacterium]MCF7880015.1 hypothetical protein [Candidatus Neomarinimicrobiota bacterium]
MTQLTFTETYSTLPIWAPNAHGFYYKEANANNTYSIVYYDFETAEKKQILNANKDVIRAFNISPDGSRLVITGLEQTTNDEYGNLYFFNLKKNKLIQVFHMPIPLGIPHWVRLQAP